MTRVKIAPLDVIIGILATRHSLTISEESLPEQVTTVLEKSTSFLIHNRKPQLSWK